MAMMEKLYRLLIKTGDGLQSPFLLIVRLYWGWQFEQSGWGHLTHLDKTIQFFQSLNIPAPAANAYFISGLEFVGGILLFVGLASRPIALLLAGDMAVAFITSEREALATAFADDNTKFLSATPLTFLIAALIVFIFGPGRLSLDALIARVRRR